MRWTNAKQQVNIPWTIYLDLNGEKANGTQSGNARENLQRGKQENE